MVGIQILFKKATAIGLDSFNNTLYDIDNITVEDCLIAPNAAPAASREQQAMNQFTDQVVVHIPKAFTGDLSNAHFAWNGKIFHLDSDSVIFMNENTPTRWNRYFNATSVGVYDINSDDDPFIGFFITEDSNFYLVQESA